MAIKFYKTVSVMDDFNRIIAQNPDEKNYHLYFTQYILIILYAEIENKLMDIIGEFFRKNSNEELSVFLKDNLKTIIKRIDKQDIKKTLKMFGRDTYFEKDITEIEYKKYQNFITNRHNVAHFEKNISLSWQELQEVIEIAEKIINNFARCLSQPNNG